MTRGIENKNPGNLRKSKDKWQGLSEEQKDKSFFQFKTPEYGIRALSRTLINYQDKYGLKNIDGIISRWAPPNENNTSAYIKAVSNYTGKHKFDLLDMHTYGDNRALVEAIIYHENGSQPYDDKTIDRALLLAGITPPKEPLTKSRTIKGAGVVASGGAASLAVAVADPLIRAQDYLRDLAEYSSIIRGILAVTIIAGAGLIIYARYDDWKRS